jgi:hypothetical protein
MPERAAGMFLRTAWAEAALAWEGRPDTPSISR